MTALSPSPFSPAEIASEGIRPEEYTDIVQRLGRHPNRAELGMFGVMWSEHCCYKNSRPLLKQFPTQGPRVLVGPGENAGVVDLGPGLRLAFKIESHNHPSAVEPFQGAATGVGGILRDIFTMGARPIAILNSLRFGDLGDARTRQLVKGVVAGISHYGNCLVAESSFIWRNKLGEVKFDTIGKFVEDRLPQGFNTWELAGDDEVETLSIDPETHQSCWQPVRRVFRRQTQKLLNIKTATGRVLNVTPDHPSLVRMGEQWDVRPAQMLQIGDCLPILTAMPPVTELNPQPIDLLEILAQSEELATGTYVSLPNDWQPNPAIRLAMRLIEPSITRRCKYLTKARLPLAHFLRLEEILGVERHQVKVFRRGKANHANAVIHPNHTFARLLGYYLAEGCTSANENTYKIVLTFALHEEEYVNDVVMGLKQLGLRPCIEYRKSTIAVYATSWLLGHILKSVWQCGEDAHTKNIPGFVFQWPQDLQQEVLKGLLRGDGSLTTQCHGSHAKVSFATTSPKLFEQVLMLVQALGATPSIYRRSEKNGQIEGRYLQAAELQTLEVQNFVGLQALSSAQVFSSSRNQHLVEAVANYQGAKYSSPRFEVCSSNVSTVKIRAIELQHLSEPLDVYDVEVENTHLFVTSSGLITHNCVGVPTVGGEVYFDPAYSGNPLVNAMALGLMETEEIVKSGAMGIGNPVLYVGSTTGRDGMGGASFASAELTEESTADRPAVQVGDPFLEKSLIEACLEAFKTGAVVAAQDMGAAGITCSTSEMAAKGGVGIDLDLDLIPVRETGMVPYEYLLSESQERMLFVAEKGRETELIEIFHRWGLQAVVAGTVIAEPIVRIHWQGQIAAEVPATALADNTPLYERELLTEPPAYAQQAWTWQPDQLPACDAEGIAGQTWNQVLDTLLTSPSIASKRWVYRQYDHQVQNNTVLMPGGADAAVIRLRPQEPTPGLTEQNGAWSGVAATVDCNARYVYLNPYEGAKAAVAEAARNLSCVGAEPIAVTDNLNFGSPENPVGYWQLAEACRGLSQACREMGTPVTGGNVSLYNETVDANGNPQPIYPTPVVGMVGFIPDLQLICGQGWRQGEDLIYLLGEPVSNQPRLVSLGASEYLARQHQTVAGQPPQIDLDLERRVQAACRMGIRQGWVQSAHDCSEGGLVVALAEACISGERGAVITLPLSAESSTRWDLQLFGEGGARILVSVPPAAQAAWEAALNQTLAGEWQQIGQVSPDSLPSNLQEICVLTTDNRVLIKGRMEMIKESWQTALENQLSGL